MNRSEMERKRGSQVYLDSEMFYIFQMFVDVDQMTMINDEIGLVIEISVIRY